MLSAHGAGSSPADLERSRADIRQDRRKKKFSRSRDIHSHILTTVCRSGDYERATDSITAAGAQRHVFLDFLLAL